MEGLEVDAALDAEDDFFSILGVLGEVLLKQGKGVELGGPVELSRVPEIAACFERSFEGFERLLL